jgi:uncharacterized protein YabE (DUF348 family)
MLFKMKRSSAPINWPTALARVIGLLFLTACTPSPHPTALPTLAPATPAPLIPITISVLDNGLPAQIETTAPTIGLALWEAGYRLYLADGVQPALDQPVRPGLAISVTRAQPLTLIADGRMLVIRTSQVTVGAALAEAGLALVGLDYAIPSIEQPVDGVIRVVRVREEVLVSQEALPYETVYQAQAEWEIDTVQALQAGVNGSKERRVRVRYEDGVEVSRVDEGEFLTQSPTPYIIGYGTNIVIRTLDTPDGPVEYWRSYTMYATSYAAKFLSRPPDSPNYGRTASGKILTKGLVAIDRNLMPFGTRLYVPGYGLAEAADTGGGVKGRFIDLGFDDWNYESWHWEVTVYFLTPTPPADQIRWIIPFTVP